ncbi:hypothetical protein PH213_35605 [Streptomyces sp. SRF1]|uniref:hypothetical protein n=1 Tax=Streptomyces sp. SRF1 TaxID=1549642 RepID=UPI0025B240E8|nr:hypothetical protein [Streptomyces sp. SRF1]MDN3059762.1 hypothetical protein [Streptomyces sp. SRF1]
MRVVALDNLSPEEGRLYLAAQRVPPEWQRRLLAISHGHPLTLSMLVDAVRRGAEPRTLAEVPDVVRALLTEAIDVAPRPQHRTALEVCAHGRTLADLGFQPAPGADYRVGDGWFPVFEHDWRRTDVTEWLCFVRARQAGASADPAEPGHSCAVLSEDEFARAVRDALRDLHTPERIRDNPLLRSRMVRRRARGDRPPADTFRDLLATGTEELRADLGELVDRTFLHPATTQERVAQGLHLSFNTYRRHRDQAVAHLTEWLWAREVGQQAMRLRGSGSVAPPR